jgi:hypothetical protein
MPKRSEVTVSIDSLSMRNSLRSYRTQAFDLIEPDSLTRMVEDEIAR